MRLVLLPMDGGSSFDAQKSKALGGEDDSLAMLIAPLQLCSRLAGESNHHQNTWANSQTGCLSPSHVTLVLLPMDTGSSFDAQKSKALGGEDDPLAMSIAPLQSCSRLVGE